MNNFINILLDLYKLKFNMLNNYVNRSWQRFNWLFTIESAWLSLYFTMDKYKLLLNKEIFWIIIGIIISFLWFIMGLEDYSSIKSYSEDVKKLEKDIYNFIHYNEDNENKRRFNIKQTSFLWFIPLIFFVIWIFIILFLYVF